MHELDTQRDDVSTIARRRYAPTVTIYRELSDGSEREISVEYHYVRAESGYMCGRQTCPPTPAVVELGNAYDAGGSIIDLTDDEAGQAMDLAFERRHL